MNNLDWLWNSQEEIEEVGEVPAGGGDFTPGFTGKWVVSRIRSAWVERGVDLDGLGIKYDAISRIPDSGSFVYWKSEEDASIAQRELGMRYPPRQVWRWEMPVSTMIGFGGDDAVGTFGEVIGYDSVIVSPKSKNRVPFQFITLPSAMQAMGILSGVINEKIFDYESLVDIVPEVVTDEIEEQLVGTKSGYTQSDLWRARANIWEALGEPNAHAYIHFGKGSDYDATKEDSIFNMMLRIVYKKSNMYGRVLRVREPRVDAVTNSGNHLQNTVVAALFASKEDAEKALGISEEGKASAASNGNVKLPEEWIASNATAKDWTDFVMDMTKDMGVNPVLVKKALNETDLASYGCTSDEVFEAWKELQE